MKSKSKLPYRIEARVDEHKFKELQQQLDESNYNSMSELIRDIIYDKRIVQVTYDRSLDKTMEILSAIRSELHAIGVNINQVTRYFNAETAPAKKIVLATKVAMLYEKVGVKVDELQKHIGKLGERWLQ